MQTRPTPISPSRLAPRYIRPLPVCPFCKRKFTHYHEVYLHAMSMHDQVIDSTFTCELCKQVCQNRRGLNVHTTHSHKEWTRGKYEEEESEGTYKRRQPRATSEADDSIWHTPVSSPVKSEFPAIAPVLPAPSPLVTCPVCGQVDSANQAERHISVHDSAVTQAYCDLTEVAKVMVAGLVLELAGVKKYEK